MLLLFRTYFSLTASAGKAKGGESLCAWQWRESKGKEEEGGKESFSFSLSTISVSLAKRGGRSAGTETGVGVRPAVGAP